MSDDLKQRLLHIGCFASGDAPCTCVTGILALNRIEELEAKLDEEIRISNLRGNMIEFSLLPSLHEAEAKLRASAMQELAALGQAQEAHQAQLEAEAKLAKAVDVLKMADQAIMENATDQDLLMWGEPIVSHIRAAIAELKAKP